MKLWTFLQRGTLHSLARGRETQAVAYKTVGKNLLFVLSLVCLTCAVQAQESSYSYSAQARAQVEFGTLLGNGQLIRQDFISDALPHDPHGLKSVFTVPKIETGKIATPMLQLFFRGADYWPVFGKQGYFIVFYNPLADVALVTFWKVNGTQALFLSAQIMPAEKLYLDRAPQQMPHWMRNTDFLGNMRQSMKRMMDLSVNTTSDYAEHLEQISKSSPDEGDVRGALERLANIGIGLSDKKIPCGHEIGTPQTLAGLRRRAAKSNLPVSAENRPVFPVGGMTNSGLSFRFFAFEDQADILFTAVADETNRCEIMALTGVQGSQ